MSDGVEEAIVRAQAHLRNAAREGLEALRAILDAASRAGGLGDAVPGSVSSDLRQHLDAWIAAAENEGSFEMPGSWTAKLHQTLDAEIHRWEARSRSDETARPVLRGLLGLREILWELGLRSPAPQADAATSERQPPAAQPVRPETNVRPRVQRFVVDD